MPSPQSKRYCFSTTQTPGHVASLKKFEASHCKYLVYNQDASTIEGFFTLKEKLSATGVRKALHLVPLPFLEAAKGSSKDIAASYKDGDSVEFGEPPRPGKRTDLYPDVRGVARFSKPTTPDMRQYPTVNEYMEALNQRRDLQPSCTNLPPHHTPKRKRRKLSDKEKDVMTFPTHHGPGIQRAVI